MSQGQDHSTPQAKVQAKTQGKTQAKTQAQAHHTSRHTDAACEELLSRGGFSRPALVCRWRLFAQALPLENRHLRALSQRDVQGQSMDLRLVAWAKQHIEWTLFTGASAYPQGVLMLVVDEDGKAAMTVGPYTPLAQPTLAALCKRVQASSLEALETGVAPESMWAFYDGMLYWGAEEFEKPSGANSLVLDLAKTLGIHVVRKSGLLQEIQDRSLHAAEIFMVSDEHGVVADREFAGSMSARMAECYKRLLAAEEKKQKDKHQRG